LVTLVVGGAAAPGEGGEFGLVDTFVFVVDAVDEL